MRISVMGAGTWGTALAQVLAHNDHDVHLWDINTAILNTLEKERTHHNLPQFSLEPSVVLHHQLQEMPVPEMLLVVVPSQVVRNVMQQLTPLSDSIPVVCASKGIENNTLLRMSEVISQVGSIPSEQVVSISGPSHAEEVARMLPTAAVSASTNIHLAREVQKVFTTRYFRIYAHDDIVGVELSGAVKNVIAIAAGICDGIGFGDNTMAALITRGLAEIVRLGVAQGARLETFSGLSGVGDLVVTANSTLSRNRYVGKRIGEGATLDTILDEMDMVAEGVKTTRSMFDLSRKVGIEMPICDQVYEILFNDKEPRKAITELMNRELVDEHHD